MKNKHFWFETVWHQQMVKALQIAGMGDRTQETYVRAMRKLCEFYNKTPDHINKEELVDYFIHRQEITEWSPATMRICYSGIKFFFINVLKRKWHTLKLARAKREKRLPAVLSREEVQKFLAHVDIAEIELSVLKRQCLAGRIDCIEKMRSEVAAWNADRNNRYSKVDWQFRTDDAANKAKTTLSETLTYTLY